jgi:hypothetical protein
MQKKIWVEKSFFEKKTAQSQQSQILVQNFFFWKKPTQESKLVFPINLTILYPNLQKKI